jgi:hypothetical protein
MSSEVLDEIGRLVGDDGAYFVGGCVRDVRLGLPVTDVDVVVAGDPATVARRLARETGGSPFALSEAHGAWRVVLDGRTLDITAQRGGDILADLGERDFTVNAMAIPVDGEASVVDPFGGLGDLAEGRLRLVSDRVFTDDPLRLLKRLVIRRSRTMNARISKDAAAIGVIVMRFVDLIWLTGPELHNGTFSLSWMDLILPAGIGGIWLWFFATQLKSRPLLPIHDPDIESVFASGHGH